MRNVITTFLLDICAIIFMDFYEDVFRGKWDGLKLV